MSDSRVRMVFGGGGKYSFADDLSHTCVLQADGKVTCWGKGTDDTTGWLGQVLDPAVWGDPSKIKALDLDDVKQIAVGPLMTCALLGGVQDGDLICWGGGGAPNGKNRDETTQPVSMLTPVIIPNGETPTQIVIGVAHACAIVTDGSVYCWGDGTNGQLGDGRCMNVDAAPQYPAKNIPPVRAVAAGRYHTCALVADYKRAVWCWGSNVNLSLGIGKTGIPPECPNSDEYGYLSVPAKTISFGADIRQLVAGDAFSCLLTESGTVHCWGLNNSGQLGLSRNDPQELKEPTEVKIDKTITQISARRSTTCALTEDGEVWCWGDNSYGQAGTTTCEQTPLVGDVALPHKVSLVRPAE
ncbi:hypothetical protein [Nannocystis sp.]|uniref:RCC1 domain-containing protein n=1 Tax=Nannocystis sp. TaxID=1962667 RepID=UPI0025F8FAF1|nr:hypothetical protein [Nannocystis sp.]MBK7829347.1 hypothetical protein [Nannocystis sp.]